MYHRSADKSDPLTELKREVDSMTDPENKSITQHMVVVMAALEGGANIDRLVKRIGYSREFIESIELRMRKAGLSVGELVDDRECLDQGLKPLYGIFSHALVAQGAITRIPSMNGGCVYLNAETGKLKRNGAPELREHNGYSAKAMQTRLAWTK